MLSFSSLSTGVADQLQTNYASDLRGILKTVFEVCAENPTYHGSLPPEASTWIEGEAQAASNGVVAQDKDPAAAEGASRRRRHRSNGSRNRAHSVEGETCGIGPTGGVTE